MSKIMGYIWNIASLLGIYFVFSFVFLCLIFKKVGEKRRKGLIPFYNLFTLFKVVGIKKKYFRLIWLNIIIMFLLRFLSSIYNHCPNCEVGVNEDGTFDLAGYYSFSWFNLLYLGFSCLVGLYFSLLMFIVYYHLFRRFGWNKLNSILGTIFFPIGACILGFGNFQCKGDEQDEKEDNKYFS